MVGETSVLIVVASAHRGAAFEACRWLIDTLKKTVPIWKKEQFVDGAIWADGEPFPEEQRVSGSASQRVVEDRRSIQEEPGEVAGMGSLGGIGCVVARRRGCSSGRRLSGSRLRRRWDAQGPREGADDVQRTFASREGLRRADFRRSRWRRGW